MTNEEIINRFELLTEVLIHQHGFSRKQFTIGEVICINQERGSLFDQLNVNENLLDVNEARFYSVPESIESKIKIVLSNIK